MTEKRFRVFKFPDVNKFGVSDDIVEVTVAFCDKKWEADYLCDLLNDLNNEKESWRKSWIEELNDSEEQSKCILKLANENEELKKEIQNLQAKLNILEQAITGDNKQWQKILKKWYSTMLDPPGMKANAKTKMK